MSVTFYSLSLFYATVFSLFFSINNLVNTIAGLNLNINNIGLIIFVQKNQVKVFQISIGF